MNWNERSWWTRIIVFIALQEQDSGINMDSVGKRDYYSYMDRHFSPTPYRAWPANGYLQPEHWLCFYESIFWFVLLVDGGVSIAGWTVVFIVQVVGVECQGTVQRLWSWMAIGGSVNHLPYSGQSGLSHRLAEISFDHENWPGESSYSRESKIHSSSYIGIFFMSAYNHALNS